MRAIYVGGYKSTKKGGFMWKIYLFLFLFIAIAAGVFKVTGPTLVEQWINQNGSGKSGYAFSIRDVDISLGKGEMVLKDVKVFNPKTESEILESPELTIQLNLSDLFMSQEKKVSINAEKVDLILSKDFSSELERIKTAGKNEDIYLDTLVGKIGQLNIIEQKEDQSRTVLELNEVNLKVKEVSSTSINQKTEFSISSKVADGGKFNLSGKTGQENGRNPWSIQGSLKQVPAGIFNKIAGDDLPFSFHEASLNAEINAHSEAGKISGEIVPEISKVNLLETRPGIQAQPIKRILSDELSFTLPFTLKDELNVQYEDTYQRLKTYRKYPAATNASAEAQTESPASKAVMKPKEKKKSFFFF